VAKPSAANILAEWLRRLAADHDGAALIVAKTVDGRTLVKFASVERLLSPEQDEEAPSRQTPRPKRKLKAKDCGAK
jgi:hypothetical protein